MKMKWEDYFAAVKKILAAKYSHRVDVRFLAKSTVLSCHKENSCPEDAAFKIASRDS